MAGGAYEKEAASFGRGFLFVGTVRYGDNRVAGPHRSGGKQATEVRAWHVVAVECDLAYRQLSKDVVEHYCREVKGDPDDPERTVVFCGPEAHA